MILRASLNQSYVGRHVKDEERKKDSRKIHLKELEEAPTKPKNIIYHDHTTLSGEKLF